MPISSKPKGPTRAAIEARATIVSEDIFAGRSFRQPLSDVQELPKGDNRYRVTPSAKFYIVQLMGTWVHVSESAERTVQYRNRLKYVRFENREYDLKSEKQFKPFVGRFIQWGCYAYVGGKQVDTEKELKKLIDQPFIYISSSEALKKFNALQKEKQRK